MEEILGSPGMPGSPESGQLFPPSLFVIEGEDLIKEIQEAKTEDLPEIISTAIAFKEGLVFGTEDYDLNDSEVLLDLQNLFTSTEGAVERPSPYYLDAALKKKIGQRVRELKRGAKKREEPLTEEEKRKVRQEIHQLVSYENHLEGRKIIDQAFIQRMRTCEDPGSSGKLLLEEKGKTIMPDKGHWQGALSGEFGEGVDRVLREITKAGMHGISSDELRQEGVALGAIKKVEDTVYTAGFKNTETFRVWLSYLLHKADQRMDVVWFAWKLALLWEIPDQVAEKKIGNNIKLAFPPIGNALFTWIAHFEKKRAIEFGLDANGKRVRDSKYISHSGYPLSLGKIGNLCGSFLKDSKVKEKGEDVSLWTLWWDRGMKVGGNFGIDKKILPWALIEMQPRELATDEFPQGTFGSWILNRYRAFRIQEDVRSRPSLRDLSDPDFFAGKVRNWDKIFGPISKDTLPEKNPRVWWVAGILLHSHSKRPNDIPLVSGNLEKAYKTRYPPELWSAAYMGKRENRSISVWEILNHAHQCGFLREKDIDWLVEQLNLPKPLGGAKAY